MSELEQLEQRVRMLSPHDLASFRAWFHEFDKHAQPHGQSGNFDRLVTEAMGFFKSAKGRGS
jgi:hypothetical protein